MSRNRHGPSGSCGCCGDPCYTTCPDGTTSVITEVEWDVTFPTELIVWRFEDGIFPYWTKGVYSTASLSGTYIVPKNSTTCSWQTYSDSELISATYYSYPNEVIIDSGSLESYNCPNTSSYSGVSTLSNLTVNIFANPFTIQFNFLGLTGLFVAFDGYAKGPNSNSPCESATLTWNSLDNFPVDNRCTGISNSVVTAVLTPTIL